MINFITLSYFITIEACCIMPSFLAESFGDANENNLHSTKPI
jgi:hypothetical protein